MEIYSAGIFIALGAFIVLDIATGLTQAIYNETIDSKILRNGMFHKLSYVFAIILALALEYACSYMELGFEPTIFLPLAVYIIVTEAVSILENIIKINPDLANSPIFKLLSEKQNRRIGDHEQNTEIR